MSKLIIPKNSNMDENLEKVWFSNDSRYWKEYLLQRDGVIHIDWIDNYPYQAYTTITFKSDTYKNLFILRWS